MRGVLCLLAIGLLVAGCSSSSPEAATRPATATTATTPTVDATPQPLELGLQDDALLTSAEPQAWPLARGLGVQVVRYNVAWNLIAPTRPADALNIDDPAYDWSAVDRVVDGSDAMGARALLTIVQSPDWANGGQHPAFTPDDPADYGTFCRAVATRYDGHHGHPRVTRFTVWNEPNGGEFFRPQDAYTSKRYADLARSCIDGVAKVDAAATVAIGPLASRGSKGGVAPLAFLDGYRAAGGPEPAAVAINPYMFGLDPIFLPGEQRANGAINLRNLDSLQGWLSTAYGSIKPLWITEFAWRTAQTPGRGVLSDEQQATLTSASVQLVRSSYPYVRVMVWFLLRDQGPEAYWRSGLVRFDWQRKPVYDVWAQLARTG